MYFRKSSIFSLSLSPFLSIIILANKFFITNTYKNPHKKLKTCVPGTFRKNWAIGAWLLSHSQHDNNHSSCCFLVCPINFLMYVVFLFLSFFAFTFLLSSQPSKILTVCCTSLFFPGWKCRPLLWQQKGSEESKQRLFSLLSCILLAHSSWRQYACMCVWEPESRDKQQHTAAHAAQTSP